MLRVPFAQAMSYWPAQRRRRSGEPWVGNRNNKALETFPLHFQTLLEPCRRMRANICCHRAVTGTTGARPMALRASVHLVGKHQSVAIGTACHGSRVHQQVNFPFASALPSAISTVSASQLSSHYSCAFPNYTTRVQTLRRPRRSRFLKSSGARSGLRREHRKIHSHAQSTRHEALPHCAQPFP